MKLKLSVLDDKGEFMNALTVLAESNAVPPEIAYRAGRIFRRMKKELLGVSQKYQKLVEKYAERGEDGKVLNWPNGPWKFKSAEDESAYDDEYSKIFEEEVEENVHPIPYDVLKDIKTKDGYLLSGAEQVALEPILEF